MRRSIFAVAILLSATASNAQNKKPFKSRLLPKHTYTVDGVTNIDSHISSSKDKKVEFKRNVAVSFTIATGTPDAKGTFPFIITVTNFSSKDIVGGKIQPGSQSNQVKGARSQGSITADGKMHTETITFVTADEKTKNAILSMLNKFGDEIKFPARPMKIGESFIQNKPFTVANGGKNLTVVTYTLKSIKGNLAFFDTKETITGNITDTRTNGKFHIKTNGTGKGTMIYDMVNNFAVTKTDNLKSKMNIGQGTTSSKTDDAISVSYKAKISAN